MEPVYRIYKQLGETPLEALERVRAEEGIAADVPMTYAGRLDPAAEGVLIVLAGEECKNKDAYLSLPKTYLAEILLGVETDTYDLLGMPSLAPKFPLPSLAPIAEFIDSKLGWQMQPYPPYSSKPVDGTPLHAHARAGNTVDLPEHEVELISYEDLSVDMVEKEEVLLRVGELVSAVTGDFRQKDITLGWAELDMPEKLPIISVTLSVSSGFYVREFAHDLGAALGTGACLYSLVRTQVGN